MGRQEGGRRRGGVSGSSRSRGGFSQLDWRDVLLTLPPIEPLAQEQLHLIHETSLRILEEGGLEFMCPVALKMLDQAGCKVDHDSGLVLFDRHLVEEMVAKAPSSFTLTPRNPERCLTMGGQHINFGLVGGPANAHDIDRGRRSGNFEDFSNLVKLAQSLNILHLISGGPVAPIELPTESRHLDMALEAHLNCDKVITQMIIGRDRAIDGLELIARSRGCSIDDLNGTPVTMGNINTNSPRRVDQPLTEGMMALIEFGQPVLVTPFTLLGAMAPVTIAGALALSNAEALGVITLAQLCKPGTPVVYGCFTSNVDMKSGAPAFGTPEYTKATQAGGQLARFYNLPYRSSNTNASNCVDAQAAYESTMSLWGAVMGRSNMVNHAAGWMEGGLTASYEKMILDAELLQGMAEYLKPISTDEGELALEAIKGVPPGGHFFGEPHTMERYETAFYDPILSDWRNFETWEEAGAETATLRANKIWKDLLKAFEPPPIDAAYVEAMRDYIERRKREIETQAA